MRTWTTVRRRLALGTATGRFVAANFASGVMCELSNIDLTEWTDGHDEGGLERPLVAFLRRPVFSRYSARVFGK